MERQVLLRVLLAAAVAAVVPLVGLLVLQTQLQEVEPVEEAEHRRLHLLVTLLLLQRQKRKLLMKEQLKNSAQLDKRMEWVAKNTAQHFLRAG
jgi:hypothetical protein